MISNKRRNKFKPTFLYIKRHTKTGKLYFGKTTLLERIESYNGSGTYWANHIKAHGIEFVETIWYCLFTEIDELVEFATQFSETHCIVESSDWANQVPEDGISGSGVSMKRPDVAERNRSRRGIKKWGGERPHPNLGKKYSDEYKARLSAMRKGKKISEETRKKLDKKKQERESSPEFIEAKKKNEIERAERRKKQYDTMRESHKGFACYTDHTGATFRARTDDPRIERGEIWGKNKGKSIAASEESKRINSESKKGLKRYVDKDGNKRRAKEDDPRVLSGEFIKDSWAKTRPKV
jgi:hypothetical protein